MGAWRYCGGCDCGLPPPSDWSTLKLLTAVSYEQRDRFENNADCSECGAGYYEDEEFILEELADRIDEGRKN